MTLLVGKGRDRRGVAIVLAAAVALTAPAFLAGCGGGERTAKSADDYAEREERRRAERDDLQRSRDEHRERMREGP